MSERRISPTRLKLYDFCPTKYFFQEVLGLQEDDPRKLASFEFGTNAHKVAELVLTKQWIPEDLYTDAELAVGGRFAETARRLLGGGWELLPEHEVEIPDTFRARFDLLAKRKDEVTVIDYKTTSDFKYALTADTLRKDIQCRMYAYAALQEVPDAPSVDCFWIYCKKSTLAPHLVTHTEFTREDLADAPKQWAQDLRAKMLAMGPDDMPEPPFKTDPYHAVMKCGAYGGCKFWDRCRTGGEG